MLLTLVVFDGEIGVVEHLRDQAVVEVMALDRVVFVHRADSLDHLCWKQKSRFTEEGSEPLEEAAIHYSVFATADCLAVIVAGSHLMKYMAYSFLEFEIIINEVLSSLAHFQAAGSIC